MKKALLIADSGGTKTDWCILDSNGNQHFFETESYHPHLINEKWIEEKKEFWKEYAKNYELQVHFFGSGCANSTNQKIVKQAFQHWGIQNVQVDSDLIAAGISAFGNSDGLIAILGTGSVIASIEDEKIKKIYGGLGYLLGDEGSGYNFGKMLLQDYFHSNLSQEILFEIEDKLGNREKILNAVYSAGGKKYISGLSTIFSKFNYDEISEIHRKNIQQFLNIYLPQEEKDHKIHFVGSYASYNELIVRELLIEMEWEPGEFITKPIEKLTEYFRKRPF